MIMAFGYRYMLERYDNVWWQVRFRKPGVALQDEASYCKFVRRNSDQRSANFKSALELIALPPQCPKAVRATFN
jgi:hypothetical protein